MYEKPTVNNILKDNKLRKKATFTTPIKHNIRSSSQSN